MYELLLSVQVVHHYSLFLAGCLPPWDSLPVSGCYVFGKRHERNTDVKGATQLCLWVVVWTRGRELDWKMAGALKGGRKPGNPCISSESGWKNFSPPVGEGNEFVICSLNNDAEGPLPGSLCRSFQHIMYSQQRLRFKGTCPGSSLWSL